MALSNDLGLPRNVEVPNGIVCIQPRIGVTFRPGCAVVRRIDSKLAEVPLSGSARTDLITLGYYVGKVKFVSSSTDDGNGGSLDVNGFPEGIMVEPGKIGWFATGTGVNEITIEDQDKPCYWRDDDTVWLTDNGGTLSFAGFVADVRDDGRVRIRATEYDRVLYDIFGAVATTATAAEIRAPLRTVRNVVFANVADLTAYTVAASTSLNDNVLNIAGDRILLAGQTTAAQNGIYVVGTVASGTAPLTRVADMPAGAVLPNGIDVNVSEGGVYKNSTWRAMSTQTGGWTVATHDPVFYPREYRQTVTLAAGTYTIGVGSTATPDEPLFLFTTNNVQCTLNTGAGTLGTNKIAAPTASRVTGKAGTAVVVINSLVDAGTVAGSDTSTVDVLIRNG